MGRNIAFITHSPYPYEVRARRMAEALAASGYGVDIFCLRQAGEPPVETLNGVHVYRLPVTHAAGRGGAHYIWEYLRFFTAAAWNLTRRHVRQHYALAQVFNPPDILTFATLLPRLLTGMRVILDVRDMAPELFQSRFRVPADHAITRTLRTHERWACNYADAVTVCTRHQFNVQAGRGIAPDHMQIIMNCPDEAIFGPLPDLAQRATAAAVAGLLTEPRPFKVIYHGGIYQRYGLDVLIRAAPALRAAIPNLSVEIYGAGDFLPTVQARATELGVGDVVHFCGYRPIAELVSIVQAADVGVVPLRGDVFTDTILPTKLLEYVYLGTPAVAARTSTVSETFDEEQVAFFESGNAQDLAEQVIRLYRDPQAAAALARQARRFTAEHSWHADKAAYLALVEQLI